MMDPKVLTKIVYSKNYDTRLMNFEKDVFTSDILVVIISSLPPSIVAHYINLVFLVKPFVAGLLEICQGFWFAIPQAIRV